MSKETLAYIRHIADECAYLVAVSNNVSIDKFLSDETLKRAVVRSL